MTVLYCECYEPKPIKENGDIFCEICGGFVSELTYNRITQTTKGEDQ